MIVGTRHLLRPMKRYCRCMTCSSVVPPAKALYCWIHCLIMVAMSAVHRENAKLVNQRPLTQRSSVEAEGNAFKLKEAGVTSAAVLPDAMARWTARSSRRMSTVT